MKSVRDIAHDESGEATRFSTLSFKSDIPLMTNFQWPDVPSFHYYNREFVFPFNVAAFQNKPDFSGGSILPFLLLHIYYNFSKH